MNTSNFINLIGRLGDDPKTTTLPSGTIATEFSLATKNVYRDRDGNRQTRTEWHRVKAYNKLAELFDTHLRRGEQISIVGSMRYSKWIDKYEQPRTSAEVIADSFSFIGSQNRNTAGGQHNTASMVAEPFSDATMGIETKKRNQQTMTAVAEKPALESAKEDLPF